MAMLKPRVMLIVAMIAAAAAARLLPHPPNMTPIFAMALFGGATLTDKRFAFAVPGWATSGSRVRRLARTHGSGPVRSVRGGRVHFSGRGKL